MAMLPGVMQQGPQGEAEGEGNATPEEQAIYDKFVDKALDLLSNEKLARQIVDRIKNTEDKIEALATQTVFAVRRVRDAAQESGQQIPGDVLAAAGVEVCEAIGELANRAKAGKYTDDDVNKAYLRAVAIWTESEKDEAGKQEAGADWEAMQAADREGRLGELLPGLDQMTMNEGGEQ